MKRPAPPTDPLHARCIELCQELERRVQSLRDYATSPGNSWLAQGELDHIAQLSSELSDLIEQIRLAEQQSQG